MALSDVPKETVLELIKKFENISKTLRDCSEFSIEWTEDKIDDEFAVKECCPPSKKSRKHQPQISSLISILNDTVDLKGSSKCLMEFGAGTAELSYNLAEHTHSDSKMILLDRSNARRKVIYCIQTAKIIMQSILV